MIQLFYYTAAFAFGTAAGSFMNVCIYRMPRGLSVAAPRSACPLCGASLGAAELIPLISYAALRGRCASCRGRISTRYPLVEFLCGALWAALLSRFWISFEFACFAALCTILLAVLFIDAEWMRIPNALSACAAAPAAALYIKYALFSSDPERFRSLYGGINAFAPLLGLLPAAFFAAVFIVSALINRGGSSIGMGDVKLLMPTGLALGLRLSLLAAFIAVVLGGLAGMALIISGKKKRKDPIPFGPFIVIGAYAAILLPVTFL